MPDLLFYLVGRLMNDAEGTRVFGWMRNAGWMLGFSGSGALAAGLARGSWVLLAVATLLIVGGTLLVAVGALLTGLRRRKTGMNGRK